MSTHIGAEPGDIAERVLMPGDPLRAKWIAETYLKDARCYSTVVCPSGLRSTPRKRVTVQAVRGFKSRRHRH